MARNLLQRVMAIKAHFVDGIRVPVPAHLEGEALSAYVAEEIAPILNEPTNVAKRLSTEEAKERRNEMVASLKDRTAQRLRNGGPTDDEILAADASSWHKDRLARQYPEWGKVQEEIEKGGRTRAELDAGKPLE